MIDYFSSPLISENLWENKKGDGFVIAKGKLSFVFLKETLFTKLVNCRWMFLVENTAGYHNSTC